MAVSASASAGEALKDWFDRTKNKVDDIADRVNSLTRGKVTSAVTYAAPGALTYAAPGALTSPVGGAGTGADATTFSGAQCDALRADVAALRTAVLAAGVDLGALRTPILALGVDAAAAQVAVNAVHTIWDTGMDTLLLIPDAQSGSVDSIVALANGLAAAYTAHVSASGDGSPHNSPDAAHDLVAPPATNLATAQTLLNDVKAKYNLHRVTTTSHLGASDSTNTVAAADATNAATATTLANAIKVAFEGHADSHAMISRYPAAL